MHATYCVLYFSSDTETILELSHIKAGKVSSQYHWEKGNPLAAVIFTFPDVF